MGKRGPKPGCVTWNKGLRGDPRCARPELEGKAFGRGLGHTVESKAKLSVIAKDKGLGGYNERSGRGHKGRYKGYWCDSSYELAWVIYQLDHGIPFTRNTAKFQYEFEGKTLKWIPDFIMADGSYVEIKGFETAQSKAKIAGFQHPIVVLKEKDLTDVFQYVKHKYGSDFVRLYTEG